MIDHAKRTRLYEPGWEYVPHDRTNIRARFDAIRAQFKQAQRDECGDEPAKPSTVRPLRRSKP